MWKTNTPESIDWTKIYLKWRNSIANRYYKAEKLYEAGYLTGAELEDYVEFLKYEKVHSTWATYDIIHGFSDLQYDEFLLEATTAASSQNELLAYMKSPQFQEDLDEGIRQIHEDYGERMLEMAQMLCPKDTLTLTNSLYLIVDDDGVSIFSDCDYFPYVEAKYHMVETAYNFYEPLMIVAIQLFITSKMTVGT